MEDKRKGSALIILVLVFLSLCVTSGCVSTSKIPPNSPQEKCLSGSSDCADRSPTPTDNTSGNSSDNTSGNSSDNTSATLPSSPGIVSVDSLGESIEVRWSAPVKPGGLIIGYNLNLTDQWGTISSTAGANEFSTSFFPIAPNTTYRIYVAAVNREGQGPAAAVTLTTPPREVQNGKRWLFLSRLRSLRKKEVSSGILALADCLPEGQIEANITGVAVHHNSSQVYFSEGVHIWVKGAGNLKDLSDLRLFYSAPLEVTALSVDWLYRKLYFISNGKVFHCRLDSCSDLADIIPSIPGVPSRIVADPYNGYLFLLFPDGIYRTTLPASAGLNHNLTRVVIRPLLHDMAVSFTNKRLVFFDQDKMTVSATSLGGSNLVTLRPQVGSLSTVQSLTYEDDLFMLTDGRAVYQEVKQGSVTAYNEFLVDCDDFSYMGFDNLRYFSPTSQPCPVPRRPRGLQVVFGSDKATGKWEEPELRLGTSPSAWQNWTYTVTISLVNGSMVESFHDVTETQVTVPGLQSDRGYLMTVWAESPGGHSASVTFEGTALKHVDDAPFILGAGPDGFWKQDLDTFDHLQPVALNIPAIRDMDWYNSTVFWSNTSGHINILELKDRRPYGPGVSTLPLASSAGVVAFDWLGKQLYYSCNSTMVCRTSVLSIEPPEVFLNSSRNISSLVIDSLHAFIYWATEHTVERARLDGEWHVALQQLHALSGKRVAGITIDIPEGVLYWLVQDASVLHLYRASVLRLVEMRPEDIKATVIGWSSSEVSHHALVYYSGRLVWLDGSRELRVQEVGQKKSVVLASNSTLTTFTLLQSTLKPLPAGFVSPPIVIPQAVEKTSIRLEENHTVLRIQWEPSSNVEFGSVFYCVETDILTWQLELTNQKNLNSLCHPLKTLSEPYLEVRSINPYKNFNITITPFTYWGQGDPTSKILYLAESDDLTDSTLVISLSTVTGILLALLMIVVLVWHRRRQKKELEQPNTVVISLGPDEELEEIRGLVGLANACYAISPLPVHNETGSLPVFPRECLSLKRLLGSGAFGEVYEGVTVGHPTKEVIPQTRVAVKTLRKDATDNDKVEFLKEAHLMSQFDHANILRLLGVCVLNEPQYLILELMEGGDLRSYLRGARPSASHGVLLSLPDLLDICCDTAKGCAYLEKMHFVHRDLAARNCLVSVRAYSDPGRTVKIGDFGLARDVYKNDYYRKRGEGLLPVRWMSPESLSDGVFNKHTDVWAFGVLLWEVATLGQHPYPAYSNLEVLHHVNSGGRLQAPADCPQRLYELMLRCWSKAPSERPSFRSLKESLTQREESETHSSQDGARGLVNQGYQEDDEECSRVDEDECPGAGLTHVLSEEGLNYLMFTVDGLAVTGPEETDAPEDAPEDS